VQQEARVTRDERQLVGAGQNVGLSLGEPELKQILLNAQTHSACFMTSDQFIQTTTSNQKFFKGEVRRGTNSISRWITSRKETRDWSDDVAIRHTTAAGVSHLQLVSTLGKDNTICVLCGIRKPNKTRERFFEFDLAIALSLQRPAYPAGMSFGRSGAIQRNLFSETEKERVIDHERNAACGGWKMVTMKRAQPFQSFHIASIKRQENRAKEDQVQSFS
jgi:hypothetical protein